MAGRLSNMPSVTPRRLSQRTLRCLESHPAASARLNRVQSWMGSDPMENEVGTGAAVRTAMLYGVMLQGRVLLQK
jgi:hypothetical protein